MRDVYNESEQGKSTVNKVDDDMKASLESDDPWLQRKQREKEESSQKIIYMNIYMNTEILYAVFFILGWIASIIMGGSLIEGYRNADDCVKARYTIDSEKLRMQLGIPCIKTGDPVCPTKECKEFQRGNWQCAVGDKEYFHVIGYGGSNPNDPQNSVIHQSDFELTKEYGGDECYLRRQYETGTAWVSDKSAPCLPGKKNPWNCKDETACRKVNGIWINGKCNIDESTHTTATPHAPVDHPPVDTPPVDTPPADTPPAHLQPCRNKLDERRSNMCQTLLDIESDKKKVPGFTPLTNNGTVCDFFVFGEGAMSFFTQTGEKVAKQGLCNKACYSKGKKYQTHIEQNFKCENTND